MIVNVNVKYVNITMWMPPALLNRGVLATTTCKAKHDPTTISSCGAPDSRLGHPPRAHLPQRLVVALRVASAAVPHSTEAADPGSRCPRA